MIETNKKPTTNRIWNEMSTIEIFPMRTLSLACPEQRIQWSLQIIRIQTEITCCNHTKTSFTSFEYTANIRTNRWFCNHICMSHELSIVQNDYIGFVQLLALILQTFEQTQNRHYHWIIGSLLRYNLNHGQSKIIACELFWLN